MIQAYKKGLYGSKHAWFMARWFRVDWWKHEDTECTHEQLLQAVDGVFYAGMMYFNPLDVKGLAGLTNSELEQRYVERSEGKEQVGRDHIAQFYDGLWAAALALNQTVNILQATGMPRYILCTKCKVRSNSINRYSNYLETITHIALDFEGWKLHALSRCVFIDTSLFCLFVCVFVYFPLILGCMVWKVKTVSIGHPTSLERFNYSDGDIGDLMTQSMREVDFQGVLGRMMFDDHGDPTRIIAIDQQQGGLMPR